ncbi:MAG: hypothetical protein QF441_11445, partial [Bacteriovoracaceae bacterium]|nr:hypothetical protein [Bacteriovoracaceae bacterium]
MYLKLFSYFMMVFLSFSCVSEVYITMADRNSMGSEGHIGAKDITMSPLELTSVDFSQDVYLTVPFSGDSNNDVAVVLYFCSIKVQPGCDPMSGESVSLTKSGSNLVGSISIALSSQLTPGDIMKYQLATIDADGVTGGSDYGYILIPYDGSVPRSIRQLGLFSFGSGTPKYNAGSDDYIYASAVGGDGSLYFAGRTKSSLGEVNNGGENVVIIKLTPAGNLDQNFANEGVFQLGIVSASIGFYDSIETIVLDDAGNLFAAGYTYGSLGGANAGSGDGFILKINANSGVLDTAFGDGDGSPNDGIVQINASNSADASSDDSINSIAHNGAGSLFVGGETYGSLGGVNAGSSDGFILKMNANSGVLDTAFGDGDGSPNDGIVQLNATNTTDASSSDYIKSIVLDGAGDLFVGGYTSSSLGGANAGGRDGFIVKMNASSGVLDTAFGDGDGSLSDGIVQLNATNTGDASSSDNIRSISLDGAGNLFAAGYTFGSLGGANAGSYDGFIVKMNASSGVLDTAFGDGDGSPDDGIVQLNATNSADASSNDFIQLVFLDGSGNLFVGGYTEGSLGGANAGGRDGFIVKMNASSGVLDTSFGDGDGSPNDGIVQLNTTNTADASSDDFIQSFVLDGAGNLFVGGYTEGSLGGANAGGSDGFILKMNASSGVLDTAFGDGDGSPNDGIIQLNTTNTADASSNDYIRSIVLDGAGNLFAAGYTEGSLGGANAGGIDGFILKMNASSGVLDTAFGDGDGTPNDGIVQINASNSADASFNDYIQSIGLDAAGDLFAAGYTSSSLGGINAGSYDAFILKMDTSSGVLDTAFGDGDGSPNDGIVQLNATNTGDASSGDFIQSIVL